MLDQKKSKKCRTCQRTQPLSAFFADPKTPTGRYYECRKCSRKRNAAWKRANWNKRVRDERNWATERRDRDPLKALIKGVRDSAKARGLVFDISLQDLKVPKKCPALGITITPRGGARGGSKEHSPSVDRIDNKKGYIKDNIVVVSWRANRIKSDASIEELEAIVQFYKKVRVRK